MGWILCAAYFIVMIIVCLMAGKLRGVHPVLCVIGALLLGPLMLFLFLRMDRRQEKKREKEFLEDEAASGVRKLLTAALCISLATHALALLLDDLNILAGLVPVLEMATMVLAGGFFLVQAFLVPPVGMLILSVVGGLLFLVMPYIITILLAIATEGLVLLIIGSLLAAFTAPLVIFVVNGTVLGAALVPMAGPSMIIGGITMGTIGTAVLGITVGMDAAMKQQREARLIKIGQIAVNLLLLVVLVWPVLSWTDAFSGMFALKPAVVSRQEFLQFRGDNVDLYYERFFEGDGTAEYEIDGQKNWTFGEGFYDRYIYPGRNSFAQGKYPSAADGRNISYCLGGKVYQVNTQLEKVYKVTACSPSPEDAMVMVGEETFLFSDDQILLMGRTGRYRWKDTNWRSDFEKLSDAERFGRLYAILEAQNDGVSEAVDVEDVAVVAYAQRNGLLLYYDSENHAAYFGQKGKKGSMTILRMDDRGLEECTSFTPECDSDNLPYTMINAQTLAYIRNDQVVFKNVDTAEEYVHLTADLSDGKTQPVESFHVVHDEEGTEFYACVAPDVLYLEQLGESIRSYPFEPEKYDGTYSVGTELYSVEYDSDSIVNRLTFLNDRTEGEAITAVWTENPTRNKTTIGSHLWKPEETVPAELTLDERFPIPELRTSARQVGLYRDNVASPSEYASYRGPANEFTFRFPRILYENVEYTWSEDETEVCIRFWNTDEASSLTVTLRPNAGGADHRTVAAQLQKLAEEDMVGAQILRSGPDNEEGTASAFYLRGYEADDGNLICTRLCRVDSEHIMEMELRVPTAVDSEDRAYKEFYIMAMERCCGFGSGEEYTPFREFKKKYGQ